MHLDRLLADGLENKRTSAAPKRTREPSKD
jgi:hypothetical protein